MSTAVRFEKRGDKYAVTFAYNPNIVALIKTVPAGARSWKPDAKLWFIDAGYAPSLAASMRECGYIVTGMDKPKPDGPGPRADWAQLLFARVGQQRAEPVFRALTRVLHPDTPTGDTQLQRELNNARDRLSKGH